MIGPMGWNYDDPEVVGWYAVLRCWEPQEGIFPGSSYWDGKGWYESAVTAHSGPFPSEKEAEVWADEHDPER
jgi:hypothetical protein